MSSPAGGTRAPFAVVASMRDRLSVAGDPESVAALLAVHAPSAIMPGADLWPVCSGEARGDGWPGTVFFHQDANCPGHSADGKVAPGLESETL